MTRPRRDAREHTSLEDMSLAELRAWAASYGLPIPAPIKTKPTALAANPGPAHVARAPRGALEGTMKTVYVVTGEVEYEGSRVLGAFGSQAAAEYFARRVDLVRECLDGVAVTEWRAAASRRVSSREREW